MDPSFLFNEDMQICLCLKDVCFVCLEAATFHLRGFPIEFASDLLDLTHLT